MTTSDFPLESQVPCEKQPNGCDFCVKLSEAAMRDVLIDGGVHPASANILAQNTPLAARVNEASAIDALRCNARRERAGVIGESAAERFLESSGVVLGGERKVSRIDTRSITRQEITPEKIEFYNELTNDFTRLTKTTFIDTAERHGVDVSNLVERIDKIGWPTSDDEQLTWREDRQFGTSEEDLRAFNEFITDPTGSGGPNNFINRFRSRYRVNEIPYVQAAKAVLPETYDAIVEAMSGVEGLGHTEIMRLVRESREEGIAFLSAYRTMYVLMARLMRAEDIQPRTDVADELWT